MFPAFSASYFLLPHWSFLARIPCFFQSGTARLCLYNTVISQNQETDSLLCGINCEVSDRRFIFWIFEHYLRFFFDLSLDKLSGYCVISSSPKPRLTNGLASAMQARPASHDALCSAPFSSSFTSAILESHNIKPRVPARRQNQD